MQHGKSKVEWSAKVDPEAEDTIHDSTSIRNSDVQCKEVRRWPRLKKVHIHNSGWGAVMLNFQKNQSSGFRKLVSKWLSKPKNFAQFREIWVLFRQSSVKFRV